MRITLYRSELDENKHNVLVKENCTNYPVDKLNSPAAIAEMLNIVFRLNRQAEEHLYMVAFNNQMRPLGVFEVSHGTATASFANPREIYIKALLCGATNIVLAHNHPAGSATPSPEDVGAFKRVLESGKLLGVDLIDFMIIGDTNYSFKENGLYAD